jgi:hypothetical protein
MAAAVSGQEQGDPAGGVLPERRVLGQGDPRGEQVPRLGRAQAGNGEPALGVAEQVPQADHVLLLAVARPVGRQEDRHAETAALLGEREQLLLRARPQPRSLLVRRGLRWCGLGRRGHQVLR